MRPIIENNAAMEKPPSNPIKSIKIPKITGPTNIPKHNNSNSLPIGDGFEFVVFKGKKQAGHVTMLITDVS